ncbi:freyrasin family ranthipeptide [Lysinibacillus sp. FJAT-14745]
MLKRFNHGFNTAESRSKWCVFCDTKDYCNKCDSMDWGCSGGWET